MNCSLCGEDPGRWFHQWSYRHFMADTFRRASVWPHIENWVNFLMSASFTISDVLQSCDEYYVLCDMDRQEWNHYLKGQLIYHWKAAERNGEDRYESWPPATIMLPPIEHGPSFLKTPNIPNWEWSDLVRKAWMKRSFLPKSRPLDPTFWRFHDDTAAVAASHHPSPLPPGHGQVHSDGTGLRQGRNA